MGNNAICQLFSFLKKDGLSVAVATQETIDRRSGEPIIDGMPFYWVNYSDSLVLVGPAELNIQEYTSKMVTQSWFKANSENTFDVGFWDLPLLHVVKVGGVEHKFFSLGANVVPFVPMKTTLLEPVPWRTMLGNGALVATSQFTGTH